MDTSRRLILLTLNTADSASLMSSYTDIDCWVVTDGKPGMENQCLGLAEALGFPIAVKRVRPRVPWRWLPPRLWLATLASLGPNSDPLQPPWPRLLIASGRMSVAFSMAIRRRAAGKTFTVQIQSPGVSPSHFDLVVPPRHDWLRGDNVFPTRGALHRVTPERLRQEAAAFENDIAGLPRPLVAVLIGGDNGVYRLGPTEARELGHKLVELTEAGAGLAVTLSRRTGGTNEQIIRDTLAGTPAIVWDSSGPNPYFGYLGLADTILVTCDSVSMTSEAASTGKPVYVVDLPGGSTKFRAFHDGLRADGITRPFTGTLETWSYTPPDDTAAVAAEVRRRLQLETLPGSDTR